MIRELTVKQHLEMAEKQWTIVLKRGVSKNKALELLEITHRDPRHACYLCEVFKRSNDMTDILRIDLGEEHCFLCPLSDDNGTYCNCEYDDEPYKVYDEWFEEDGEINKDAVTEILELIRFGKKQLNY